MEKKYCSKCGMTLPVEMFNPSKAAKDGYYVWCKKCKKEYYKKYHISNKEFLAEQHHEYYIGHKKHIDDWIKQYTAENKELVDEYHKQWYLENKEAIDEQHKQYYEGNRIVLSAKHKKYNQEHPEQSFIHNQRRKAMKLQLPSTLTVKQWRKIKQHFNNMCAYCGKEKPLTQDHFIPLSKGGEYTINNIIPACQSCNSGKHNKDFFKWYPKYKYYSKKREKFLLTYLGYENNNQQLALV